jgi:hypothetical protein
MVAERFGLDMARSFAALPTYTRNHDLRLADVAGPVISGDLTASELSAAASPL